MRRGRRISPIPIACRGVLWTARAGNRGQLAFSPRPHLERPVRADAGGTPCRADLPGPGRTNARRQGALRQGHRQRRSAWQIGLGRTGGRLPARILPCRLLARAHLCARREAAGRRRLPYRSAAATGAGAGANARAIAGDRPALQGDDRATRTSRTRAPRQRRQPCRARSRVQGAAGRDRRHQGSKPDDRRYPRLS